MINKTLACHSSSPAVMISHFAMFIKICTIFIAFRQTTPLSEYTQLSPPEAQQ
jgi:hypothetical protein